jgi:hypothetical protein
MDRLTPAQRRRWRQAHARGDLRRVHHFEHSWIFRVPPDPEAGAWTRLLTSTASRSETLSGLARTPLDLPEQAGRIEVLSPARLTYVGTTSWRTPARLDVTNASDVSWPGFDPRREGLVELRYAFSDHDDRIVKLDAAPLDIDVPAGSSVVASPLIASPTRRGRYRLCLDLVQVVAGELRPLPVAPVELEVDVDGSEPSARGAARRLALAYRERGEAASSRISRCAALRTPSD